MKRREFIAGVLATKAASAASSGVFAQTDAALATPAAGGDTASEGSPQSGYAPVNGLQMYYEIHGSGGVPLVLLHGAFSNIDTDFGKVLPLLVEHRPVIGVEQQGHGRTADIDRPLSYEQMADDTAALLRHLNIEQADIFGYSFGSGVGLQLAVRHPDLVRKLVAAGGTSYSPDGLYPEVMAGSVNLTPEALAEALMGTPWQLAYAELAPNPDDWTTLVEKKVDLDSRWQGWSEATIQAIEAPVLLIIGDADIVRLEHAVEFFRLLGGGVPGDLTDLPPSQLAILPGTTHVTLVDRTDWLATMIEAFLNAPIPEAG